MRLTICIATYGDKEWEEMALTRALPSVKDFPCEVLVGHDSDGTIASVRNGLAERAMGEWLCFLDADDELDAGYLAAMELAVSRNEGKVLLTPAVQKFNKGRIQGRPTFYPEVDLKIANWLVVGTLVQTDLFLSVGGFGEYPHGFEDWSLWAKCAKMGARVVKVPRAIYIQHINPQSKHRLGWKNRRWQVQTHQRVEAELAAWTP